MANHLQLRSQAFQLATTEGYSATENLNKLIRKGMIVVGVLVFGLGGLAGTVPITGAVIAGGALGVESHTKKIAHPTGGVLAELLVKDGDRVRKGQPLMRLDDTVSGANAEYTGENVYQLMARAARLRAERDQLGSVQFPAELTAKANDPEIRAIMAEEQQNFQLRRASLQGQIRQLGERIRQTQAEISGYDQQASSYDQQGKLIAQELDATRKLYEDRYTTLDKLNALERAALGVRTNAATARTSAAQGAARISELQQQRQSLLQESRSTAASELADVMTRVAELKRLKVTADDSLDRSVLRAPQAGVVDKIAYTTVGGVIPPGETLMEVVPENDNLVVRVQIPIDDIDQVSIGREAALRFSAFSMRTTPEIDGKVTWVSADREVDPQHGTAFYRATISVTEAERRKLGNLTLVPGMPVEAFIQSGNRTLLNYILKPLSDQLARAFRHG